MKVTIKDVAKEAGVAPSTVSRVLSDSALISEETKKRVHVAVEKLKFKPNAIARSLANNKTQTLGIILPSGLEDMFGNPFYIQAMQGISVYASQHQYYMMYAVAKDREEELQYARDFMMNGRVDGVIMLKAEAQDDVMTMLQQKKFPFVVIGRPDDQENMLWVDNDNCKATYQVVVQLIEDGYDKIGFISAKKDWVVSQDRLKGYRQALEDKGMTYDEKLVYHGADFNESLGSEIAKKLKEQKVSAIVTTDDLIAIGVNRYFTKRGQKLGPIIGFNNTTMAQYERPPISSIDVQAVKLGWYATKLLINQLEHKDQGSNYYTIETEFIKRYE